MHSVFVCFGICWCVYCLLHLFGLVWFVVVDFCFGDTVVLLHRLLTVLVAGCVNSVGI